MLFKVYMHESFREDRDLVGFIEAPSADAAAQMLAASLEDTWADEVVPEIHHVLVTQIGQEQVTRNLVLTSTDEDGNTGSDIYVITRAIPQDVCLFHGEQWRRFFS